VSEDPVVPVPADLELDERLVGAITFRMAAWLAVAATGIALAVAGRGIPGALAGVVLTAVGLAGALWVPGGRSAPSWVRPLWGYWRRSRGAPPTAKARLVEPSDEGPPPAETTPLKQPDERLASWSRRAPRRRTPVVAAAAAMALVATGVAAGRLAREHFSQPTPVSPSAPASPAPPAVTHDGGWPGCGC
jgi:hypothetical protein